MDENDSFADGKFENPRNKISRFFVVKRCSLCEIETTTSSYDAITVEVVP